MYSKQIQYPLLQFNQDCIKLNDKECLNVLFASERNSVRFPVEKFRGVRFKTVSNVIQARLRNAKECVRRKVLLQFESVVHIFTTPAGMFYVRHAYKRQAGALAYLERKKRTKKKEKQSCARKRNIFGFRSNLLSEAHVNFRKKTVRIPF